MAREHPDERLVLRAIAVTLVRRYLSRTWRIFWTGSLKFYGECTTSSRILRFSMPLALAGTHREFIETVKHEIAHALAPEEDDDHGPLWKATARKLGIKPDACVPYERSKSIKRKARRYR